MITSQHIITLDMMDKRQRYRERKRMAHKCRNCGKPIDGTSVSRCNACLKRVAKWKKGVLEYRTEQGLCLQCGKPVEEGFKFHNRNECVPSRRVRI